MTMPQVNIVESHQHETANEAVILDKVSKTYQMGEVKVNALENVSLELPKGEFIVILGPSGSGKTTLLNLLGGMDSPSQGEIYINGSSVGHLNTTALTRHRREHIGFIFQFFNLIPSLTAEENIAFAADLVKNPRDTQDVLRRVGLEDRADHFPSQLSGGEQQRVAIARALVTDPPLILADEPTGSLDYETGKLILKVLRKIVSGEGKTVVLVTHNAAIAQMADRVVRLRSGKVQEIKQNPVPLPPDELEW